MWGQRAQERQKYWWTHWDLFLPQWKLGTIQRCSSEYPSSTHSLSWLQLSKQLFVLSSIPCPGLSSIWCGRFSIYHTRVYRHHLPAHGVHVDEFHCKCYHRQGALHSSNYKAQAILQLRNCWWGFWASVRQKLAEIQKIGTRVNLEGSRLSLEYTLDWTGGQEGNILPVREPTIITLHLEHTLHFYLYLTSSIFSSLTFI